MKESFFKAKNRFECIDLLEQAVRQKKGGYTEEERQHWLRLLYSCLKAPNSYFEDDTEQPGRDEDGGMDRKAKKKIDSFSLKVAEFQQSVKRERTQYRPMYIYLACIRDLFYKGESSYRDKDSDKNPLATKLQEAMQNALNRRISENPKLEHSRNDYQAVLSDVFKKKQKRLNHPAFFLFLPYYLFFELGKCEKLLLDVAAFSVPQLDRQNFNWSIRNSLILSADETVCGQLDDLYDLVESTLCKALHEYGHHSIGQILLSAVKSMNPVTPIENGESTESEKDAVDYGVSFSAPLWSCDTWAEIFCEQFDVETVVLIPDIYQLFSLKLRPSSPQADRAAENILGKYSDCSIELRGRTFHLPELLKSLGCLYDLKFFCSDGPFETAARLSLHHRRTRR